MRLRSRRRERDRGWWTGTAERTWQCRAGQGQGPRARKAPRPAPIIEEDAWSGRGLSPAGCGFEGPKPLRGTRKVAVDQGEEVSNTTTKALFSSEK